MVLRHIGLHVASLFVSHDCPSQSDCEPLATFPACKNSDSVLKGKHLSPRSAARALSGSMIAAFTRPPYEKYLRSLSEFPLRQLAVNPFRQCRGRL